MSRAFPDWINAFIDYASFCEAPPHIYYWTAVSTIAGALNRKVWIDQYFFRWYPNFYVIFVAPPEVIAKSTSASLGMDLLREIPGVKFGPNVLTWQALVKHLSTVPEEIEISPGKFEKVNCLTIESSELGNLLAPEDRQLVDMLVTLWDGRRIVKETLTGGTQTVDAPLLNILACTTPAWLNSAIPEYMRGGGLLSRFVFVYAQEKARLIANPGLHIPSDLPEHQAALVQDLSQIAKLQGEMGLTKQAVDWTETWYRELHETRNKNGAPDHATRRQTMLYKLAMVLSASRRDTLVITDQDFQDANKALLALEPEAIKVYRHIGQKSEAKISDRIVETIQQKGTVSLESLFREFLPYAPKSGELKELIETLISAGLIEPCQIDGKTGLRMKKAA